MDDKKEWYIKLPTDEKIIVSEEVFKTYWDEINKERIKKTRANTCQVRGKNGKLIRCPNKGKCSEIECPYLSTPTSVISLDQLYEDYEYEVKDTAPSIVEQLAKEELEEQMAVALSKLDPFDRKIVELLFWEGMSERDVAKELKCSQNTVNLHKKNIFKILKPQLEQFR